MRIMRALWRTAPPVLFVMAILSAGFFTGAWVVLSEVFPRTTCWPLPIRRCAPGWNREV